MHPDWRNFLVRDGAVLDGERVLRFVDPARERRAAAGGDVLLDLSALSLVRVSGADASAFLTGQLTQDVATLDTNQHRLAAYCTAQGRMLAIARVFRRAADYYLLLPHTLCDSTLDRLRRYVLRAKVTLQRETNLVGIALAGPNSPRYTAEYLGAPPENDGETVTHDETTILRLPGPAARFAIFTTAPHAQNLWGAWRPRIPAVGSGIWNWFDIQAGLPAVFPETVEAFVPQMANLDLVGGVSFTKGCYPGQEIVARMHYLGRLKQRMYRAYVAEVAPRPGDAVYAPSMRGQSAGTVVDAQPAPDGGYDLLAVLQIASVDGEPERLRLRDEHGASLQLRSLPYAVPPPTAKNGG